MTQRSRQFGLIAGGVALVATCALGAWTVTQGQAPRAAHFPQHALPAASTLVSAPGIPIPGLDITPTRVAALYLNSDTRPDIIAMTETGEVRGLLNTHGDRPAAVPFAPAPLELSLGGTPMDLLVTDLDGDGAHDLVFLVRPAPDFSTQIVRGTVVAVSGASISVRETFLPRELVGQSFTPDVTHPELTVPVTDNTSSTIMVNSTSLDALRRMKAGSPYQLTRLNLAGGAPRLEIQFGSASGAFTAASCPMPALNVDDGKQPVSLAAEDVDKDGTVDIVAQRATVLEGRATNVRAIDTIVPIALGGTSGASQLTRTYVLTDAGARFPRFPAGTRLTADTREGRSYVISDSDATTITFRVAGGTVAQSGSQYRIALAADDSSVLRGLGSRCFSGDATQPHPIYAVRTSGGTGAQATILTDPDAHFPVGTAMVGQKLRIGSLPLGPSSRTVVIASSTTTELTLDAAAGDLSSTLHGTVEGGAPSFYAVIPPTMPDVDQAALLPNERSMLTLPDDRPAYTPPGRGGSISAAVADVDGDGQDDLLVAGGQLFLQLHK